MFASDEELNPIGQGAFSRVVDNQIAVIVPTTADWEYAHDSGGIETMGGRLQETMGATFVYRTNKSPRRSVERQGVRTNVNSRLFCNNCGRGACSNEIAG